MKRALLSLASLLGVAALASSCRSGDVQADPGSVPEFVPREKASVFFVGHSLINFEMPKNAEVLARSLGLELTWDAQIIDGAPLEIHATHPERSQSKRVDVALPSGRYDTLVMTEAVPIDDMIRYRDPVRHAAAIARLASKGRPDARIFLHEVWMHRDRPRGNPFMKRVDWRRFLDDDLPKWEELADAIAEETGHPIALLPAGRALGRLVDAMKAGAIPGLVEERDLFVDEVHLTPLGNHYVAAVTLAAVFQRSPVGGSGEVVDRDGRVLAILPERTRDALYHVAWQSIATYARASTPATPVERLAEEGVR